MSRGRVVLSFLISLAIFLAATLLWPIAFWGGGFDILLIAPAAPILAVIFDYDFLGVGWVSVVVVACLAVIGTGTTAVYRTDRKRWLVAAHCFLLVYWIVAFIFTVGIYVAAANPV